MGESVWLFLWLLTRQTALNDQQEGVVYYGKPIPMREIESDTEFPRSTVHRWMDLLIQQDYIRVEIVSNQGTIFWILNGKNKAKASKQRPIHGTPKQNAVPSTGRQRPTDGTPINDKPLENIPVTGFPTNISTISQNHNNNTAAARPAAGNISFNEVMKEKTILRGPTQAELDERRRILLNQAEEIKRRGIH